MTALKYVGIVIGLGACLYLTNQWLNYAYQVEWKAVLGRLAFGNVAWGLRVLAVVGFGLSLAWFSYSIANVFDTPLMKRYGENTQMVFAGNNTWYKAPGHDPSQKMKIGTSSDNDSFKDIYQERTFRGIAPKPGDYGNPIDNAAIMNPIAYWLIFIVWCIFMATIVIGSIHIFAWEAQSLVITEQVPPAESFERVLSSLKINKAIYGLTIILSPLVAIILNVVFAGKLPEQKHDKSVVRVTSGEQLQGKITDYEIREVKHEERRSDHNERPRYYYVDEGDRVIVVEFPRVYSAPVYITYRYNAFDKPTLDRNIRTAKKESAFKKFIVNENLTISPAE